MIEIQLWSYRNGSGVALARRAGGPATPRDLAAASPGPDYSSVSAVVEQMIADRLVYIGY